METVITATELARRLSDVLNRVRYRGEFFVIERNGESVAALSQVSVGPRLTLGQVLARLRDLERPDDRFAADLESIQAAQPEAESPEWPS